MAEPVKKPTARREWEDPVIATMKEAGKVPEYQQMMDYLMARRQVPEIKSAYLGEAVGGLFQFGGNLQSRGSIKVGEGQAVDTLVHEVTHAAERQIVKQYHEEKYPRDILFSRGKNQFIDAYEKLSYNPDALRDAPEKVPAKQLMNLIDKDWTKKAENYRSTVSEATAFAVENVSNPKLDPTSITRAPAHIDSTLATEFLILLDLAQRGQKTRPASQGR